MRIVFALSCMLCALALRAASAGAACPHGLVRIGGEPDPDTLSVSAGGGNANGAAYSYDWKRAYCDVMASPNATIDLMLTEEFVVTGGQAGAGVDLRIQALGYTDGPACCYPGPASTLLLQSGQSSTEVLAPGGLLPLQAAISRTAQVGVPFTVSIHTTATGARPGAAAGTQLAENPDTRMLLQLQFTGQSAAQSVMGCYGYDSHAVAEAPALTPANGLWLAFANPTRREASATFTLPWPAHVRFDVLDMLGRRVLARDAGERTAGTHALALDPGHALPPGVYAVRLRAGERVTTARLIVAR